MTLFTLVRLVSAVLIISAFVNSEKAATNAGNVTEIEDVAIQSVSCDPQKNDCQNGGICTDRTDSYYCSCLEGTTGDFCEEIEKCKDTDVCGDILSAKCYFDVETKSAACQCYDERKVFDPATKVCKKICGEWNTDCENGGTCVKEGNSSYCKCRKGTSGDLCEIVDECEKRLCGISYYTKCYFDVLEGKAACACLEENSIFDQDEKTCRKVCSSQNRCKNGGSCVNVGNYSLCSCLDGTSGDLCQVVEGCRGSYLCGSDFHSECYFDVEKRKAACKCDSKNRIYDTKNRVCRSVCGKDKNTCKNGGTCSTYDQYSFCSCRNGTSGDFCQIVDECQKSELCGESSRTTCYFNETSGKAACRCWLSSTEVFDPVRKECRSVCVKGRNTCKNGGTCTQYDQYSFCSCQNGTSGDFCQIVDECQKTELCGQSFTVKCYYDKTRGKAACRCSLSSQVFDPVKKVCQRTCNTSNDKCTNGGTCARYGDYTFCSCRNGTYGDFCENVRDCQNISFCGRNSGALCYFDESKETAACKCADSKVYDEEKKTCKTPCDALTDDCQNGGTCASYGNYTFCSCRNGTYGDFCENVLDCDNPFFCGRSWQAICYFDEANDTAACKCPDGKVYVEEKKICISECDGKIHTCRNGGSCIKDGNTKLCSCLNGTSGDFCENIDKCRHSSYCGYDGNVECYYDKRRKSAACRCKDNSTFYDNNRKLCRKHCNGWKKGEYCENGGECEIYYGKQVTSSFCQCLPGTSGFFCETVDACKLDNYCGFSPLVECYFDLNQNHPACRCRVDGQVYDRNTKTCSGGCSRILCQNGGTCSLIDGEEKCSCEPPFWGNYCESYGRSSSFDQKMPILLICSILAAGIFVSIVTSCIMLRGIQNMKKILEKSNEA